jgi:hypothetical protein
VTSGAVTLDGAQLVIDETGLTGREAFRPIVIIDNKAGGAINWTFAGLAEGAGITGPRRFKLLCVTGWSRGP